MRSDLKTTLLLAGLAVFVAHPRIDAADYSADPVHSNVGFSIRHLVSKTHGRFGEYDVKLTYDPAKLEKSSVTAVIQTKSINTENEKRDNHLRSPDFFNVEKYPTMTYKSTSVKRVGPHALQVDGNLTLLGVTKPVVLSVEEGGVAKTPWGDTRAGFVATAKLNRKDFGMVWNKALDTGGLMLGDDVDIALDLEAVQK